MQKNLQKKGAASVTLQIKHLLTVALLHPVHLSQSVSESE